MTKKRVVIITGLSGSGKSTVANTMEDMGFFCVDNIPVDLMPKLLELTGSYDNDINKLALVIDMRQRGFFPHHQSILGAVELAGTPLEIVFLESRDDILVRRYSQTRRQHPLAPDGSIIDGITRERQELQEIRSKADWVIDTSDMTVHELRDEIRRIFQVPGAEGLNLLVRSFGFGKGIPVESDLVFDVRFLPNPYFVEELKDRDGRESPVTDWITGHEVTRKFLEKLEDLMSFLLPLYIREGKRYLTVSIGCTGGRHRSVAVAEYLVQALKRSGYDNVEVRHRELAD